MCQKLWIYEHGKNIGKSLRDDIHTHFVKQNMTLAFQMGGWVRYIYHDVLCDKVVPKKIDIQKKKYKQI